MEQQLAQLFRLVEAAADIVQMHGEGEDEAYLCQLGRLEGEAAQLVPGIVVGVARVVADGQRAEGHVADDQRGQHEAPCEHHMDGPDIDEAAVVDVGQKDGRQDADGRCARLHHGPAVVADAGDLAGELIHGKAAALLRRPRRQRQHRHRAAEQAEQQVHLVCPFPISLNAFQKKHHLSVSLGSRFLSAALRLRRQLPRNPASQPGMIPQSTLLYSRGERRARWTVVTALQNRRRTLDKGRYAL